MNTTRRTNLIITDYLRKFEDYPLKNTYAQLYEEIISNKRIAQLFSVLHQKLDELRHALKTTKFNFILQKDYESILEKAREFLKKSGGSPIPEDFEKIKLREYDPIFFFAARNVSIPNRNKILELKLVGEGAFASVHKFKDPYYNKVFAKKNVEI